MQISNKLYDALKWVCMIFLPALSTAYAALAGIWGLPLAEQIPNSITVIALFLGSLLGVSSVAYNRKNADTQTPEVTPKEGGG